MRARTHIFIIKWNYFSYISGNHTTLCFSRQNENYLSIYTLYICDQAYFKLYQPAAHLFYVLHFCLPYFLNNLFNGERTLVTIPLNTCTFMRIFVLCVCACDEFARKINQLYQYLAFRRPIIIIIIYFFLLLVVISE